MPVFKPNEKVWLDMRNLRIVGIPRKLADKFAGPYPVVCKVSKLTYMLHTMKIHPVFHVSLLHVHHTTGRHPPEPAPIEVDSEDEYEVGEVQDLRHYGRWHKLQYWVRWRGYGPEYDSWEDAGDLEHVEEKVRQFHAQHPDMVGPHSPYIAGWKRCS